jgi:chorismate mutase
VSAVAHKSLEQELSRLNDWRRELSAAIAGYQEWLEKTGQMDVSHSLRFYELTQSIQHGRLTLAFVAEFSRGKSELINALFFSDFKQRLLPSDVGRTTMCPTELFHDPAEEPYVRLLPIESRYRSEPISQLKHMPIEWIKIRLNVNSAADMKSAMQSLAETKKIFAMEARQMGLAAETQAQKPASAELQTVEVPAWRYAMINYPHPLLTNGIAIVDTPGLNALGLEPELTLSTIPNAHAVLFLLGIDTGVTRSDMEVWQRYVPASVTKRIAILNKVDLMWDELKPEAEIQLAVQRQIDSTAKLLSLPTANVLPLSAQKALVGKIKGDAALIERSGIERLEAMIAEDIIPSRRKILARTVVGEIGTMMIASRSAVKTRMLAVEEGIKETAGLTGKGRDVLTRLWQQISDRKTRYMQAVGEFKAQRDEFIVQRDVLREMLNPVKLDLLLNKSAAAIDNTWTTLGLTRGMNSLFSMINEQFERIYKLSETLKAMMQGSYDLFHREHGFPSMQLAPLNLERFKLKLQVLANETEKFCKDPVNILGREKHFVIKRFYSVLVAQAREVFGEAKQESEKWLTGVLAPIDLQIKDHKTQLEERLASVTKVNENQESLKDQLSKLKVQQTELKIQHEMIETLIGKLNSNPSAG